MIDPRLALQRIIAGQDLARDEVESLFGQLMDGAIGEVQQAALLAALATKGEAVSEIAGAAAAMRRRVIRIAHELPDVVDTCGTGGDGQGTFNVSTAAAIVAAAAGARVAKHGNRSVSSRSGSADVLAAAGVRIDLDAAAAGRALETIGIAFLFAPKLHPAMKAVMGVRQALAVRTIFNVLGPLTNPAGARRQVIGVYARHLVPVIGHVLAELGTDHALVVHGHDGLDEITTTAPTEVAEVRGDRVDTYTLEPQDLGVARVEPALLAGGSPEDNAADLIRVLAGEAGTPRLAAVSEITALNAGAALWVAGVADDLADGLRRARQVMADATAAATLTALRRVEG